MQIHRIPGERYSHKISHFDSQLTPRTQDVHVVCLNRKVQFMSLIQHQSAEGVVGLGLVFRGPCNFRHIALEPQIAEVNGGEDYGKNAKKGQHGPSGCDAPAWDRVQDGSPDSLLAAQSSSQMSSECRVHS